MKKISKISTFFLVGISLLSILTGISVLAALLSSSLGNFVSARVSASAEDGLLLSDNDETRESEIENTFSLEDIHEQFLKAASLKIYNASNETKEVTVYFEGDDDGEGDTDRATASYFDVRVYRLNSSGALDMTYGNQDGTNDGYYTTTLDNLEAYLFDTLDTLVENEYVFEMKTDHIFLPGEKNTVHFSLQFDGSESTIDIGQKKWEYTISDFMGSSSSLALSTDNSTVYFGATDGNLYAVNSDGTLRWSTSIMPNRPVAPPVISNGNLYINARDLNAITAIDSENGQIQWTFPTEDNPTNISIISETVAPGRQSTIYALGTELLEGDGFADSLLNVYLYSIGADDGGIRNVVLINTLESYVSVGTSGPYLSNDGTIFFTVTEDYDNSTLYALNENGTFKWTHQISDFRGGDISIDGNGSIYISGDSSRGETLYAVDRNGAFKWQFFTGYISYPLHTAPVIDSNGILYIASKDNKLYALNPVDGNIIWTVSIDPTCSDSSLCEVTSRSITLGEDNLLYVGLSNSILYSFNLSGEMQWKFEARDQIHSAPVLGNDGTIYFTDYDTLYAVQTSSHGLATSPWSTFRKDNQNTGVVL